MPQRFQPLLKVMRIAWASPYSVLGLLIGCLGVVTGGGMRRHGPVLEFHGGFVRWFVTHLPTGEFTLAMTLGHVVLGQSVAALDVSHQHELVHVRQFERWGPFMGFAYLGASAILWIAGRDPYRDNPFEREAYGVEDLT